ncbi:TauD/TfdA dioxygenase family protein [Streptomyces zagrosensis]|uniref:(5R)-carbapenem-3-carboxylate synthase n=1 Tax=Streptomyces zagrosensis TaxID=1042984 RepID=A0A7W9UYP7_9ACTN|nr:TauD/TfdA family dioxygenase [Streptomyces zagrosensis]MBB5936168.1 (5R)-carbapenem-3-carboxylate synthase [Streptomyces zagrosensis]
MTQSDVSALTPSGFGALRDDGARADPKTVRELALESGVAVIKGQQFTEEEFREFVSGLGDTISYEDDDDASVGYGFTDILHLDGTREEGKVITGRGGLPLHTDGVLLSTQVDLIVLYAAEVRELKADGATLVCDQIRAWQELPDDLRAVLDRGYLEYVATERGYFTSVPQGWYPIPTFRDYGRVKSLNLALPFQADEALASWDVRVPHVPAAESERFFTTLRAHLSSDRYLYEHRWTAGDLVVIDNQRTLHGRRGLTDSASRKLLRGQVTLAEVAGAPGAMASALTS